MVKELFLSLVSYCERRKFPALCSLSFFLQNCLEQDFPLTYFSSSPTIAP